MPIYQNIQQNLSFIILKSFAEKTIHIGNKYKSKKIKDYGEELLKYITNFNVLKVNEILTKFPSLISKYIEYQSVVF